MSVSDELALGFQTTGLGLLVVFVALAMIILIISLLGVIMRGKKKEKTVAPKAQQQPAVQAPAPVAPPSPLQDTEVVAVLAAAVAAYMGAGSSNNLVVRSYRRISADSPWAKAGRDAQIYNKF